jgi:hypothetical protein
MCIWCDVLPGLATELMIANPTKRVAYSKLLGGGSGISLMAILPFAKASKIEI